MHFIWRCPSLVASYTWKLEEESRLKWIAADGERYHLLVTTIEGCISDIYSSLLQLLPALRLHRYR